MYLDSLDVVPHLHPDPRRRNIFEWQGGGGEGRLALRLAFYLAEAASDPPDAGRGLYPCDHSISWKR